MTNVPTQPTVEALEWVRCELIALCEATDVQCNSEAEKRCTQPFHWDDGVPYCNTCGFFRATVAHEVSERRNNGR